MKHNEIFNIQHSKNAGMTVPDGFFENFNARMAASLPVQEWEKESDHAQKILPRTFWQKTRPFVYMAAMFMGIWCMMKMFDLIKSSSPSAVIEENQTLLSAIDNDAFYYDYCINDMSDDELYDDLFEQGIAPEDIIPE